MIDTHRLAIFRSVVESGSMNRAARQLGYTPSAVSQHVAALQRETGLQLLERSGRGVLPTPAGRMLAQKAGPALTALGELDLAVADLKAGRRTGLSVTAFASAGTAWMPAVIAALAREHPDVRVRLQVEEHLTEVDQRRPDLAIVVPAAHAGVPAGYRQLDLIREPFLAVLPAGHELAGRGRVPLSELAEQAWIDNDRHAGPCRQHTLAACAAAGFAPRFVVETTDYPSAIAFVARGIGLTVVPRLGALALPAGVTTVELTDPTPTRPIAVQVKDSVAGTPVVRRTLQLLAEQAG